jgi:hypothetical protein
MLVKYHIILFVMQNGVLSVLKIMVEIIMLSKTDNYLITLLN